LKGRKPGKTGEVHFKNGSTSGRGGGLINQKRIKNNKIVHRVQRDVINFTDQEKGLDRRGKAKGPWTPLLP